ncbi:MAG: glycerophosphodiester phosphodiesterase family protein [Pseudomonadales bacterium]
MAVTSPQVVASECCAGLYPQNTLSGFEFCLQSKVDGIEFDVHLSADGRVVVQHDYHLNPRITRDAAGQWLTGDKQALCNLTLEQLQEYDVGRYLPDSREARSYPDYQPRDGESIPTLESFLAAHRAARSNATLWIELKTTPFDRTISSDPGALLSSVLSLVEQYGVVEQSVLLAFEWQLLLDAERACPDIGTDFLTINPAFIERLYPGRDAADLYRPMKPAEHDHSLPLTIAAAGGDWWGPYIADVNAAEVARAQDLGLQVNVWGVESTDQTIEEALLLEADAITLSDSTKLQRCLVATSR